MVGKEFGMAEGKFCHEIARSELKDFATEI